MKNLVLLMVIFETLLISSLTAWANEENNSLDRDKTYYGSFTKLYECEGLRVDTGWFYYSGQVAQVVIKSSSAIDQFKAYHLPLIYNNSNEAIINNMGQQDSLSFESSYQGWYYKVAPLPEHRAQIIAYYDNKYVTDWIFNNCTY